MAQITLPVIIAEVHLRIFKPKIDLAVIITKAVLSLIKAKFPQIVVAKMVLSIIKTKATLLVSVAKHTLRIEMVIPALAARTGALCHHPHAAKHRQLSRRQRALPQAVGVGCPGLVPSLRNSIQISKAWRIFLSRNRIKSETEVMYALAFQSFAVS